MGPNWNDFGGVASYFDHPSNAKVDRQFQITVFSHMYPHSSPHLNLSKPDTDILNVKF